MRRIYEMGFVFLLMLVSANIFITFFASIAGVTVEFSNPAPTSADVQSVYTQSSGAGSMSIINQITTAIMIPIDFLKSTTKNFDIIYKTFFGYEALLDSLYLPTEIVDFLKDVLATIVIIVITVTAIDIIASIRGGRFG